MNKKSIILDYKNENTMECYSFFYHISILIYFNQYHVL